VICINFPVLIVFLSAGARRCYSLLRLSMPVLTPAVALDASRAITLPVPLEPDIEHLRRNHGNTTMPLCFALIGQLQLPASSESLSLLSHLNCSLSGGDDDDSDDKVTWWLQQLALGQDPIYYLLPFVLITGIVCDTVSAWLLARLLLRTPSRCLSDVTSDVYLLSLTVTSDLWTACTALRALSDYVTGHVTDSLRWTEGYTAAVGEWLSYTCLWLLITMSLNAAVRLNTDTTTTSSQCRQSVDNSSYQHHGQQPARCRELVVCTAIYLFCLVSSLPQFFAYRLVDSVDLETNRTITVSELDDRLTSSYEYSVVYHWYIVCLTVLLPVPLLTGLATTLCASLLRRSRARRKKVPEVKPTSSVHGPSRSSSACDCASLDSLRLHIALIILYLLFTCPRSTVTCLQGVFSSSDAATPSNTYVIYTLLESLDQLTCSVYQASWLPLLASYHYNFRRLLLTCCRCRSCRRCSDRRAPPQIRDSTPPALTTATAAHGSVRKSVKFDMQAVEFEIHY